MFLCIKCNNIDYQYHKKLNKEKEIPMRKICDQDLYVTTIFPSILKGVGYSALTMVFLENVYYIIIVAWTLYYIMNTFFSLGSGLPWSDCEKGGQPCP